MPDVVCKCGNYVRAYVPPGTEVVCYQCGTVLTMPGDASAPLKRRIHWLPLFLKFTTIVSSLVLCICGIWLWLQSGISFQTKSPQSPQTEFGPTESPPNTGRISADQSKWSGTQNWKTSIEKTPRGDELLGIANKILGDRSLAYPSEIWRFLETKSTADSSTNDNQNTLAKYLESIGLSTVENSRRLIGSKWDILAIDQDQEDIGVLVRYYREQAPAIFDSQGQWILQTCALVGREKLRAVCSNLFAEDSQERQTQAPEQGLIDQEPPSLEFYFTPEFGYFVLVFGFQSNNPDSAVWKDLISLPSEVPIRRASSLSVLDNQDSESIKDVNRYADIFGEYETVLDKSFASMILGSSNQNPSESPMQSLRLAEQIPLGRPRRLIEIAQASLKDSSLLGPRMLRFKKEYPGDFGSDALAISLWCYQQDPNSKKLSFGDSGRVLVDAAQRLFMRTSDPLLLEIKAKLYESFGRGQESLKAINEAEKLGFKSFYLLESRIQECLESKDKDRLLDYLSQLNEYFAGQPDGALDPQVREIWRSRLADLDK